MSEADSRFLAAQARAGDVGAFDLLVRRMLRRALAAAWEFVDSRDDAEDIVQEAFTRAFAKLESFDPTQRFEPWFFTILRNTARNAAHREVRWQTVPLEEASVDESNLEDPIDLMDLRDRLDAALERMSPMQRACFRLCEMEGFSSVEVGEMIGVSDATVRTHVHRARRALRGELAMFRTQGVER